MPNCTPCSSATQNDDVAALLRRVSQPDGSLTAATDNASTINRIAVPPSAWPTVAHVIRTRKTSD